jgi:serine/threonine-protein kinase
LYYRRFTMEARSLGKYRLLEQIGRGGMGTVYKALDEMLDRVVAVKMINADLLAPEILQRFRAEAVVLAKLNHPRIATIYELAREGTDLMMVMEFVQGESCEQYLAKRGPLEVSNAAFILDQVLDALEHAHSAGIVHRDLKPSNVMITPSGDISVMDFGIARVAGSQHLTVDGYLIGTPAYMAPEQIRGEEVDGRADLYSATVMFYRLLTQHLPFKGDTTVTLIHSQLSDYPLPSRQFRPDMPEWVETLLQRGMEKDRNARFQTAAEFRHALQAGLIATLTRMTRTIVAPTDAETLVSTPTPGSIRQAAISQPTGNRSVPGTGGMPMGTAVVPSTTTGAMQMSATSVMTQTVPIPANAVVVQKPYVLIMAAVVGLLAVAVIAVVFLELRRPAATAPAVGAAQSQAASTAETASVAAPSMPAATTPPPVVPAPAATASATPSAPAATTPPSDAAPAPASTRPAARSFGGDDSAPAPAARPARAVASAPPPPAVIDVPQSFGNVKTVMLEGTKERELDALLALEGGNLIVRSRDSGAVLKTMPYKAVAAATYTHAKRPRSKDASAEVAAIPENLGGGGFLGSAKNWLTVQSKTDYMILRLDEDKNVQVVIAAIESRTGTRVEQIN